MCFMDRYVIRKIHYEAPTGQQPIKDEVQTLHFTDQDNSGFNSMVDVNQQPTAWHVAGDLQATTGEFATVPVKPIAGYDTYVNGVRADNVPAVSGVHSDDPLSMVTVDYHLQKAPAISYQPGKPGTNGPMDRYVTRTIRYHVPAGQDQIPDSVQLLHFINDDEDGNSGYTDPTSQHPVYNGYWHLMGDIKAATGTFGPVQINQLAGYDSVIEDAKTNQLAAQPGVTASFPNITIDVNYRAKSQGQQAVPYKMGESGKNDAMNRYVTETITYETPRGYQPIESSVRTLQFTNEDKAGNGGYLDPASGQVKYNQTWHLAGNLGVQLASFGAQTVHQVEGYDSFIDGKKEKMIPAQSAITADTADINLHVTYQQHVVHSDVPKSGEGQVTIQYVEKNNHRHVLGQATVVGSVGQTVYVSSTVANQVPKKWKVDPSLTIPDNAMVGSSLMVPVIHDTKMINPTNVRDPAQQDLFKRVTRTINIHRPDGSVRTTHLSVSFNRNKVIDLLTNQTLYYGSWHQMPSFGQGNQSFTIPQITGQMSLINDIPGTSISTEGITAKTKDDTVDVKYVALAAGFTQEGVHQPPANATASAKPLTGQFGPNGGSVLKQPVDRRPMDGQSPQAQPLVNHDRQSTNSARHQQPTKQPRTEPQRSPRPKRRHRFGLAGLASMLGLDDSQKRR